MKILICGSRDFFHKKTHQTKKTKENKQRRIGRFTTFKLQANTAIRGSEENTQGTFEKTASTNERSLSGYGNREGRQIGLP